MPILSVVVPHYRDLERLQICLSALERQTFPRDQYEIVVADNGSPEGIYALEEVIRGRAKLVVEYERGAGPARNAGVAASTGRILAFTDSDCIPDVAWLAEGVRALNLYDFVGGRMFLTVEDVRKTTPTEAFEILFAFDNEGYVNKKGFTVTANLFCKRDTFDDVGGFLVGVPEDLEWSRRATAKGYGIGYAAGAAVGHPARRTWRELTTKWARLNLEAYGLAQVNKHWRAQWVIRIVLTPLHAIYHTPRALFSRKIAGIPQRIAALSVLYGYALWRTRNSLKLLLTNGN